MPQDKGRNEILQAAYSTTWAILPERLTAMLATAEIQEGMAQTADLTPQIAVTGSRNNIAVITLYGTISQRSDGFSWLFGGTTTEGFAHVFNSAVKDSGTDAIVISIDSPGGTISGVPELSKLIYDARKTKSIYAIADSFAASAAYWIGSSADKLYVTPSGEVGSIGVFVLHVDYSEMLKQDGIKPTFVHGGKYKVEGNPYEPLGDEARENIQEEVDLYYDMFIADVARNRDVSKTVVRKEYGEGRMVNAKNAVRRGMADKISTLAELITSIDMKLTKQRGSIKKQRNSLDIAKARD